MGRLEDEVRELIIEKHRFLSVFAREVDIPKNTLYSTLRKGFSHSTLQTIVPIVDGLDLDIEEFIRGRIVSRRDAIKSVPVPLYGDIAAGLPVEAIPTYEMFPLPAYLHAQYPNAFMLRVKGNSMDREIPPGYYVLVNPCAGIDVQGAIYAVAVNREKATLKHVTKLTNGLQLTPNSTDCTNHTIIYDYAESPEDEVSIIGRVVWHCPPISGEAADA